MIVRTAIEEQFAGWGLYDHSAVCMTCGHQHLVPKAEQVSPQPWLDWQAKHRGHETFLLPHKLLSQLGEAASYRHNADAKVAYAASAAYTITLTGLASDTNLLAGRESSSVSNASNKYLDELVAGKVHTHESSALTTGTQIEVHAVGALNDTPDWPDVFDGTDSAETIGAVADGANVKQAVCSTVAVMVNSSTTTNQPKPFRPVGLRQMFGDALPPAHVLFVVHNTGVALGATATNHAIYHTPVYATVI